MRKKTALQIPENRTASPKQTTGLVAKAKNQGNQRRRRASLTTALIERFAFLLRTRMLVPARKLKGMIRKAWPSAANGCYTAGEVVRCLSIHPAKAGQLQAERLPTAPRTDRQSATASAMAQSALSRKTAGRGKKRLFPGDRAHLLHQCELVPVFLRLYKSPILNPGPTRSCDRD